MFSSSNMRAVSLRGSIRSRLALWYGGVLGVVFATMGILLYVKLADSLTSDFDLSLRLTAEALARFSSEAPPLSELSADDFLDELNDPEFLNKFFQFFDLAGAPTLQSQNHPKQPLSPSARTLTKALQGKIGYENFSDPQGETLRTILIPVTREGKLIGTLQVGGAMRHVETVLRRLRLFLLLTLPATWVLALIGGWFLAHKALQPVDAMAQAARRIAAGDLSRRIPIHQGQDELAQLAETFNVMIGQLEDSILRLRQFSADASHELRTPLTILKGETEMALRQARTPEEYQETLASALEEIDRISRIVEELFLLSKADLGEARLEMAPAPLVPLVKETVSQMELMARNKMVDLTFAFDGNPVVQADIYRMRELLLNLVENAILYTPSGGKIKIRLSEEGEQACLVVADTGAGISEEALPKIFDRFYRADDTRAMNPRGSGLGLSICRWIVEAHHGAIEVQSAPGEGTTFFVRLPLIH